MTQVIVRFVVGGALVAALPTIAQQFGPATAGLALLFPAVSFAGLLFVGQTEGLSAVAAASIAAIAGLPTVVAFLLAVHLGAQRGLSLPLVLALGTLSWFVAAAPIEAWRRWSRA
jgi:uncharacterized membrane protein (GlpM family)